MPRFFYDGDWAALLLLADLFESQEKVTSARYNQVDGECLTSVILALEGWDKRTMSLRTA